MMGQTLGWDEELPCPAVGAGVNETRLERKKTKGKYTPRIGFITLASSTQTNISINQRSNGSREEVSMGLQLQLLPYPEAHLLI
jgi:hypothetical protein